MKDKSHKTAPYITARNKRGETDLVSNIARCYASYTQYNFLLFNRLIVPALSNFKACAENVGSKNRTRWLYLFRNKSPISAPLQQELMTPHHQSQ